MAALGVLPGAAAAQRQRSARATQEASSITELQGDGRSERAVAAFDLSKRQRGFKLFAAEDLAMNGLKMTGTFGWFANNIGPCPLYFTLDAEYCGNTVDAGGNNRQIWFEIGFLAGAPISEARKIRQVWPGISSMQAPFGYTAPYTSYLVPPTIERWGPADGQFGTLFSGVTSTTDGSCRDNTSLFNGQVGLSLAVTLLAGSDCPETWPRTGFGGMRPLITDSLVANAALIKQLGWNEWKFPESWRDQSQFIGNFTTYGTISDSYREIAQKYGAVTKLGSGAPAEAGYPLGLDIRFDYFQFARPSIRNTVYYVVTIVNNSARLYGAGINYDSLYFGVQPGYLGARGPQRGPWYFDFNRNAVIFAGGNTSGRCGTTFPPQTVFVGGCINTLGWNATGQAILTLKSPLGDIRNKLYSNETSPYFIAGADPKKDDTITFNHAHMGGFGATYTNSFLVNDQVRFGYLSSQEDVFLAGRDPNNLGLVLLWSYFQNENWRTYAGALRPDLLKFPRYVPGSTPNTGSWDYNNDGIQDTISVPGCGSFGCAARYSDTVAAGYRSRMDNVGNLITAGPFPLKAGDTTQFIYAFIGHGDSASFEAQMNSAITAYLTNYAGPAAAPAPTFTAADVDVTSAAVRDSANGIPSAQVRIRINQPTIRPDPFIQDVINRLSSPSGTAARLTRLNPGLLARVQARLNSNVSELLVFKSCDKGQTFTTGSFTARVGGDCQPAPANNADVNGSAIGFGWQPKFRIPVDTVTGRYTANVIQDVVQAGRTYLYSFVTRTRGLSDIPVVDSIGCRTGTGGTGQPACDKLYGTTNLAKAFNVDQDTVASPLFRSGPNTVTVYAPISLPAGSDVARLDTLTLSGAGTSRLTATARGAAVTPGRYSIYFANRFIVYSRRNTSTNQIITDSVVAERVIASAQLPGQTNASTDVVVDRRKFTGPSSVFVENFTPTASTGTANGFQSYVDTVAATGLGYILARADGGTSTPYFISRTTAGTPTAFETATGFPGVIVGFVSETNPRLSITIRTPGDTLNQTLINANAVTFQATGDTTIYKATGGRYAFTWSADAWGPEAPFSFGPPTELQPQVDRSLSARTNVTTGDTTTATRTAIGGTDARPLIPVRIPFTIQTPSGEPAKLAMFRRHVSSADSAVANSRLLGTAGDTTRVSIPADLWMPGDTLYLLERGLVTTVVGGATVLKDSTVNGRPVRVPVRTIQDLPAKRLVLGCTNQANLSPGRNTCNPIKLTTRGATGYFGYANGFQTVVEFPRPFELFSEVQVSASAQVASARSLTETDLNRIRVVPNPYVVQSSFDVVNPQSRIGSPQIKFTNVPDQGMLRVYTVSGAFIQQISWTRADLQNLGTTTLTGDLPFSLLTREGLEMGPGLYLYVLTPTGSNSNGKVARGKFVIIR